MKMNARQIVLLFSHKYDVLDYFYKKCTRWQKLCYSSLDSCCSHALKAWNKHIHYKQTHLQSFFLILNKFSAKIRVS